MSEEARTAQLRVPDTAETPVEPQPARPEGSAEPGEPGAPAPLGVLVEPTGDDRVDALLARLRDADGLPTAGHLEVYEDVHRGLRDTLTALDTRPGPPAPQPPGHRTTR